MTGVTYQDARAIIQDGDIVFLHGEWRNPIHAAIMLTTGSTYSHVCIAFWAHGRLMCVEAQERTKRRIMPLSLYSEQQMTIVPAPKSWAQVRDAALSQIGKAEYGLMEAVYVGIRELVIRKFNYRLPVINPPREFCSRFVASVYGLPHTSVSPQALYDQLNALGLTVEEALAS